MTRAVLSEDRKTVIIAGHMHRQEFPVADLPQWLDFYERMGKRPKAGPFYVETVESLRAIADTIEGLE